MGSMVVLTESEKDDFTQESNSTVTGSTVEEHTTQDAEVQIDCGSDPEPISDDIVSNEEISNEI